MQKQQQLHMTTKRFKNSLLTSIFNTPEEDLPNVDQKLDMRKLLKSSLKPSSTILSCSIREMYNRLNYAKKSIML